MRGRRARWQGAFHHPAILLSAGVRKSALIETGGGATPSSPFPPACLLCLHAVEHARLSAASAGSPSRLVRPSHCRAHTPR